MLQPGDKEAVVHKVPLTLFAAFLACMSIAVPSAVASRSLIAPVSACPGQKNLDAPAEAQEAAMRCMIAYARSQSGLAELGGDDALAQSAAEKADDVIRCDDFSHFACGRDFTYWMQEAGYMSSPCWRVGENLAWGSGAYGTVRSIFRAWMNSPGHRTNILNDFTQTGISLQIGTLEGQPGTHVWAQHFGTHCDAQPPQG